MRQAVQLGAICAVTLTLALAGQAEAALLWGTTHFEAEASGTSSLYTIDTATGVTTLVGDTGFAINGLNYYNGTLYAIQRGFGGNLLTLNTSTGAGTVVGPLGDATGDGFGRAVLLAIDPSGNAFTWYDPGNDDLASVDLGTGAATIVGDSGLSTAQHGMSFLGSTLYLVNFDGQVFTLDTTTGAGTPVGNVGTAAHHGDVNPDDSLYYGLDSTSSTPGLVRLDLTTQTVIGSVTLDRRIHAVAFQDANAVPEPGTMTMMSLGGLGLAIAAYRRRK